MTQPFFPSSQQQQGNPGTQPRYLRVTDAAHYCASSKSTFDKLRVTGGGAPFLRIGKRVIYRTDDLDAWMNQRRFTSTSEQP